MRNEGGYIALISAIIISVILLGISFTLSLKGFFGRFNVLETEQKEKGLGIAEGCAERALLKLATTPGYTGNEDMSIDGQVCQVDSINPTPPYTIRTKVIVGETVSNMELEATDKYYITSWQEIPNL